MIESVLSSFGQSVAAGLGISLCRDGTLTDQASIDAAKILEEKRTHGHHIVYKLGLNVGTAQDIVEGNQAASEARDVLLYFNINPFFDKENLAFAPNKPHDAAFVKKLRNKLLEDKKSNNRVVIIDTLKEYAREWIAIQ